MIHYTSYDILSDPHFNIFTTKSVSVNNFVPCRLLKVFIIRPVVVFFTSFTAEPAQAVMYAILS